MWGKDETSYLQSGNVDKIFLATDDIFYLNLLYKRYGKIIRRVNSHEIRQMDKLFTSNRTGQY